MNVRAELVTAMILIIFAGIIACPIFRIALLGNLTVSNFINHALISLVGIAIPLGVGAVLMTKMK